MKDNLFSRWLPSLLGLGGLAFAGRLLGFVRDAVMASLFGANQTTDGYLTAYIFMDLIIAANTAIITGTLSYFSNAKKVIISRKELFKFNAKLFILIFLFSFFVIANILIYFNQEHLRGISFNVVFSFSSIVLVLAAPFILVSGVISALYQYREHIIFPGKLNLFLNTIAIIFMVFLGIYIDIFAIPIGLFIGAVLFFIYQILHPKYKTLFNYPTNNIEQEPKPSSGIIFKAWGISFILVFVNTALPAVVGFVERYFALKLPDGSFSYYAYALRIFLLPLSFVGYALSTSLLPLQVKALSTDNIKEFKKYTNYGMVVSIVLAGGCFLIIYILADYLTAFVYLRGAMREEDTLYIGNLLRILSFGYFAFLVSPIVSNIYYSNNFTRYLTYNGIFILVLQTLTIIVLINYFQSAEVLAFASIFVSIVSFINILLFLRVKKIDCFDRGITSKIVIIVLFTFVLGITANALTTSLVLPHLGKGLEYFVYLIVLTIIVLVLYGNFAIKLFGLNPKEFISLLRK